MHHHLIQGRRKAALFRRRGHGVLRSRSVSRWFCGRRRGFLLLEALIGIVLFVIFASGVVVAFVTAQENTIVTSDQRQGVELAERALEVAASIRDQDFDALVPGTHGFAYNGSAWTLSGSSTSHPGGFSTALTLTSLGSGVVRATSLTTWTHRRGGQVSTSLSLDLTDWRSVLGVAGTCSALSLRGSYVDAGTPLFTRAVRSGDELYVGSDVSSGGAGIYVFDVSADAVPVRINTGFSLGYTVRDVAVQGNVLYLLTDDPNEEIQAYDVSDPTSFGASQKLATYNLDASALGRAITLDSVSSTYVTFLVVGAQDHASHPQLLALSTNKTYSGSVVTALSLSLSGSLLDAGGDVLDLSVASPSTIYAARTQDGSELRVYNTEQTTNTGSVTLAVASGTGYNLTDVQNAQAVAASGTSALIGRVDGSGIEELVLFPLSLTSAPSMPPGPWYHEIGADVNGIELDLAGSCAFIATANTGKELIMLKPSVLRAGGSPETATYDATSGDGRGVTYNASHNRVYLLTNKGVHAFQPS